MALSLWAVVVIVTVLALALWAVVVIVTVLALSLGTVVVIVAVLALALWAVVGGRSGARRFGCFRRCGSIRRFGSGDCGFGFVVDRLALIVLDRFHSLLFIRLALRFCGLCGGLFGSGLRGRFGFGRLLRRLVTRSEIGVEILHLVFLGKVLEHDVELAFGQRRHRLFGFVGVFFEQIGDVLVCNTKVLGHLSDSVFVCHHLRIPPMPCWLSQEEQTLVRVTSFTHPVFLSLC